MDTKVADRAQEKSRRNRFKANDPDFVAPDGGWGWLVVVACGLSNFSIYPMILQFGFVFTDMFNTSGISNTQTTTIINFNLALTSCIGLLNGPIYKVFSYRQVALFGSSLVVISLFITTWCESFWSYLIFFAILYGTGVGITQAANAIAINTYFKVKRSSATALTWGITGLGPIIWPYIITFLVEVYGSQQTVFIFSAFAAHSFMFSLLLQPVHWHSKFRDIEMSLVLEKTKPITDQLSNPTKFIETPINSDPSLYLGYQSIKNNINKYFDGKPQIEEERIQTETDKNFNKINELSGLSSEKLKSFEQDDQIIQDAEETVLCWKKCVMLFDLDLFKDLIYLNIMLGLVLTNFCELNFIILTPVILKEFGFNKYQVNAFLSVLASTDVIVRLLCPFMANKIKWNERVYFIIGLSLLSIGRLGLIYEHEFVILLIVAVMLGFGKALWVVYTALIIPNHVVLQKLPAALGMYFATSGLFFILLGPLIGWLRDATSNYILTLHILNIFNYLTAALWIFEILKRKRTC